jgi:hypothetical protein
MLFASPLKADLKKVLKNLQRELINLAPRFKPETNAFWIKNAK